MTRRNSKARAIVLEGLREAGAFRSAQALHMELMGAGHSVSLATVYRNLQVLESDGVVDSMRTEGAETIYRVCGQKEHHHHLVCRSCGASTIVQKPDFERWAESVASDAGFTETTHNLEFIGLCPACSN